MRMKNKKGVSTIVTVVLLILVSITAVALIAAFVVPFIKDSLGESKDCFATMGKIEVVQGDYTGYNSDKQETYVRIKRGFSKDVTVNSLAVVLSGGGKSKRYNIEAREPIASGDTQSRVGEYNNDTDSGFRNKMDLPGEGEENTYAFNVTDEIVDVDSVQISPVLSSEKICEPTIAKIPTYV